MFGLLVPQSSEYPGVPPEIVSEALPSENPLQLTFVIFSVVDINEGSTIITVTIEKQKFPNQQQNTMNIQIETSKSV